MRLKKIKKIKINLFQKVNFDPKSAEWIYLAFLCVPVLGISLVAGVQAMDGHGRETFQMFHGERVLATEDQKGENIAGAEENVLPEGKNVSEVMSGAADLVKNSARKVARARRIARQRVANVARIRSGPIPTGPTSGLPDGRRVCAVKNDHPQSGGQIHTDEDCCPDPNEWPNPRCAYSPAQMGIMKKR